MRVYLWWPVILYLFFIFFLTSLPEIPVPTLFPHQDKVVHFFLYSGLGLLLFRAFYRDKKLSFNSHPYGWTTFWGGLCGGIDELHQYFIPGRSVELKDFCANFLGIILMQLVIYWVIERPTTDNTNSNDEEDSK